MIDFSQWYAGLYFTLLEVLYNNTIQQLKFLSRDLVYAFTSNKILQSLSSKKHKLSAPINRETKGNKMWCFLQWNAWDRRKYMNKVKLIHMVGIELCIL